MSLFPNDKTPEVRDPNAKRLLVEFRAGKLIRQDNMAVADPRKGAVSIEKGGDGLKYFKWRDRTTGVTEDELIIMPQDATFTRVSPAPNNRIFVLTFSYGVKYLFWMQEPSAAEDDSIMNKVNHAIDSTVRPAPVAAAASSSAAAASPSGAPRTPASTSAPAATPAAPIPARNVPVQGRGGEAQPVRVSPAPSASSSGKLAGSSSGPLSQLALHDILSSINVPREGSASQQADLARVLTVENIAPLLAKAEILEALFPFIPAKASRTKEELTDIINSPPFRQAVATLNEGLQTGQLSGFVAQLGLDPSVGGPLGGVQAFIEAIRLQAESSKKGSNEMQE